MADLTELDADALSRAIHTRTVSCREVMHAYLRRIDAINPRANAIVNLVDGERLLAEADACDAELTAGRSRGWLHGIPQAIKDTGQAAGLPTTFGSVLLRDAVAARDGLMVSRMRAAGCIVIGKTNMPEFGLGSHTFNALFGATPNAWDAERSAGGSSGGAAVALALRLLPVADGSDFMGSLRNPAAWNHVFGMRPSQGRVPLWPAADQWLAQLGTEGPMARSVRDLARLLSIQAGDDPRAPLAIAEGPQPFLGDGEMADPGTLRIGWLGDLGGHLAVEDGLLAIGLQALQALGADGAVIEPVAPGFDPEAVWRAWLTWRHTLVAPRVGALLRHPGARAMIKPEALWEYDQAQSIGVAELARASEVRTQLYLQLATLLTRYDALALPVTQVWPFPIGERWPQQVAGRQMDTYHRWMESTIYATFAGLPAISLPAGFHANGRWPAGVQLIGRPRGDAALLRIAAAYEARATAMLARRPEDPPAA